MVGVGATPLVSEKSIGPGLVVVGALARIRREHRAETKCGLELAGLPDSLLGGHETKGRAIEREGRQVVLAHQGLSLRRQRVEIGEGGGPEAPISLRIEGRHQSAIYPCRASSWGFDGGQRHTLLL